MEMERYAEPFPNQRKDGFPNIMLSYSYDLPNPYPEMDARFLFFDIETTGLQADASSLYLLGCLFKSSEQTLTLLQWFSNSYPSEPLILQAFSQIARKHPVPVHYNGTSFDLPYLRKKYQKYNMEFPFGTDSGIDLCRHARILKKYLDFPDCRLKTMEQLSGIQRKDPFDGHELIASYSQYIRGCYLYHRMPEKQKGISSCLPALLLHNQEDVKNLPQLSVLGLLTGSLPDECIQITSVSTSSGLPNTAPTVHIFVQIPRFMNFSMETSFLTGTAILSCVPSSKNGCSQLHISLPSRRMELKYFFENYQDYYYLPYEDMAIHKSVGSFVDKNFRRKATRENCYIKKEGFFLPNLSLSSSRPAILYENFKDKQGYLEVNASLLEDFHFWKEYTNATLKYIFSRK